MPGSVRWVAVAAIAGMAGGWLAAAGALQSPPAPAAASQPGTGTTPASDMEPAPEGEVSEEQAMRDNLLRRIAELDARSEMLKQAARRLEQGETADAVRGFLRDRGSIVAKLLSDADAAGEVDRLERRGWRDRGGRPPGVMIRIEGRPAEGHPPGAEPHGPGRGPHMFVRQLSHDEREVIREMMEATQPERWETLERIREKDPADAERRMEGLRDAALAMIELRRRDPDMYRLRLEQMRFEVRALKHAARIVAEEQAGELGEREMAGLWAELREVGGRVLDLRTAVQAQELARLQERLDQLRREIIEQGGKREDLIQEQITRLVDEARQRRRAGKPGPLDEMPPPPGPRRGPREGPAGHGGGAGPGSGDN